MNHSLTQHNEIEQSHQNSGQLYIVATPIGNLDDISRRAIEVITQCDYLAVEDSRHSRKLLNHLGITNRMVSLHEHNERERADKIIQDCLSGTTVALISDAGTPLISDPGYFLVRESLRLGLKVSPIPGACAAIAALSCSGMPSDSFVFEGFLPAKCTSRETKLQQLCRETRTLIFYESTHRIFECIESMSKVFGPNRMVTLAKEITKTFETFWLGELKDLLLWLEQQPVRKKGEFVLIVEGSKKTDEQNSQLDDKTLIVRLLQDLSVKQASILAAELTGKRKKYFYQLALEQQTEAK